MKIHRHHSAIVGALLVSTLLADPVIDEIEVAKLSYQEGNLTEASLALMQANALVTEKKTEVVKTVLPDELGSWTGGEFSDQSAAAGIFGGGGISVARNYTQGDKKATITASADSPMLNQLMQMMNNPAYAAAAGLKMHRIGTKKAMINGKEGSATLSHNNRFLIQIQAKGLSEDEIFALLESLPLDKFDDLK